jgi:hypothetical protein
MAFQKLTDQWKLSAFACAVLFFVLGAAFSNAQSPMPCGTTQLAGACYNSGVG